MRKQLRKSGWLILAAIAALSLSVGTALAHEGRPVGDYRFIVGWLEEPTYEGFQNAVSLRVNKVIDAEEAAATGVQQEEHGEPGHHHADPESTPEAHGDPGHHHGSGSEDSGEGEDHHKTGNGDTSGHHGSGDSDGGGHHASSIEAPGVMTVDLNVTADLLAGANVQIITEGFSFAPENVNGDHVPGEGHAHIYVDGVKVGRTYTPWFYLKDLTPGDHEIEVTLNANSHEEYAVNGENVQAVTQFTYRDAHGHSHAPDEQEAQNRMAVTLRLEPDGPGSANLFVEIQGFRIAPQHAGSDHVPARGTPGSA